MFVYSFQVIRRIKNSNIRIHYGIVIQSCIHLRLRDMFNINIIFIQETRYELLLKLFIKRFQIRFSIEIIANYKNSKM